MQQGWGAADAMDGVDVARLERAALNAVPAARVAWDGGFVVRAFLGGTGRANAACSFDPSADPGLEARVARIEAHYGRLGLPCRFRSTPLDPPDLVPLLQARGYREAEGAVIMSGRLASAADAALRWPDGPDEDWLSVLSTADYQTPARREEKRLAVGMLLRPAAWAVLPMEGTPAACGHAVADDGLCGLFDIATAPAFRRRGLAARVIRGLADWGAGLGASVCWLQVATGNAGAQALYAGLGLSERYRYRYFLKG
ncbi:GNAT family N-acetyltransferase [Muricoccus radiodurans]|uniref:GNAT family N-acetyltransferase n=1 Tax=Muricoccus radiodurans TaxID=2231721 RepID=UPI003CF3B486